MKKIVILGAGTAGTMMANHLAKKIDKKNWSIVLVDQQRVHYYQPGFLYLPFGYYSEKDVQRDEIDFIPRGVDFIQAEVEMVDPASNRVKLKTGQALEYHILIIATGTRIVPGEVKGLLGDGWRRNIFDFYTLEGAVALREKLKTWTGGKMVVHFSEMPIKCPVAPLEFVFYTDWFLEQRGVRQDTELIYVTPLSGAFTKEKSSNILGNILEEKDIRLMTDFDIERVESKSNQMISYGEKKIDYDLLVTVPTNMGDEMIARSGLGDELNFVPTHKHTLQSKSRENIFVIGDATDLPSSKAGSVAHFQAEGLTKNILNFIDRRRLEEGFDGHANCFIESGFNKGILIDFNYDIEPAEGKFPFPVIGPFPLLKESRLNHLGKLAFRWVYWNVLLKGYPIPGITARMSRWGKRL